MYADDVELDELGTRAATASSRPSIVKCISGGNTTCLNLLFSERLPIAVHGPVTGTAGREREMSLAPRSDVFLAGSRNG